MAEAYDDYAFNSMDRRSKWNSSLKRNFKPSVSLPKIASGKNISFRTINSKGKIRDKDYLDLSNSKH